MFTFSGFYCVFNSNFHIFLLLEKSQNAISTVNLISMYNLGRVCHYVETNAIQTSQMHLKTTEISLNALTSIIDPCFAQGI